MPEDIKKFSPSFFRMFLGAGLSFGVLYLGIAGLFQMLFEVALPLTGQIVISGMTIGFVYSAKTYNLATIEITNTHIFGPKAINESLTRTSIEIDNIDRQRSVDKSVWNTIFQCRVIESISKEKISLFPFAFGSKDRKQIFSLLKVNI